MKSSSVTSCSWCPSSPQLCFHPWDWGENGNFVLCWGSSTSADGFSSPRRSFGSSFYSFFLILLLMISFLSPGTRPRQRLGASNTCWDFSMAFLHKGTGFRRALTPQQTWRERAASTAHTSRVEWSLFVWLWNSGAQTLMTRRGCGISAYQGALKMLPKASKFILRGTGWVRAIHSDTQHLHQHKASWGWQITVLSLSFLCCQSLIQKTLVPASAFIAVSFNGQRCYFEINRKHPKDSP